MGELGLGPRSEPRHLQKGTWGNSLIHEQSGQEVETLEGMAGGTPTPSSPDSLTQIQSPGGACDRPFPDESWAGSCLRSQETGDNGQKQGVVGKGKWTQCPLWAEGQALYLNSLFSSSLVSFLIFPLLLPLPFLSLLSPSPRNGGFSSTFI